MTDRWVPAGDHGLMRVRSAELGGGTVEVIDTYQAVVHESSDPCLDIVAWDLTVTEVFYFSTLVTIPADARRLADLAGIKPADQRMEGGVLTVGEPAAQQAEDAELQHLAEDRARDDY